MFYHCLIFSSLSHLKVLFNINIILLFVIYIVHLPVVRPRSCRVIYYFDTPAVGIRYQSFDRVRTQNWIMIFFIWMCSICFFKKYGWSIFVWKKQKHKKIIACYFDELQLIFKRLFFVKHEHESMSWRAFLVIPFQFIFISYNKLLSYRQGHSQTYNIWFFLKKKTIMFFCHLFL